MAVRVAEGGGGTDRRCRPPTAVYGFGSRQCRPPKAGAGCGVVAEIGVVGKAKSNEGCVTKKKSGEREKQERKAGKAADWQKPAA